MSDAFNQFHPLIRQWFTERIGDPAEVQKLAWPKIANQEHLLISAPTGSGKTLTAFLWALNQLTCGKWETGKTRVLYVSPLKALNNDIQRNLIVPLRELRVIFERNGETFPEINVMTRSGDTGPSDRARMLRKPPEILITTPESLNLLISSIRGRSILCDLKTVILDEIHSVAGNKRGTHLITAVDRLVPLSGEFQRIALSATVRPLERIAEWVAGRQMTGRDDRFEYTPRTIESIDCRQAKDIQLQIRFPNLSGKSSDDPTFWTPLVFELKDHILRNRSTLIFANNRRMCERISFMLNQDEKERIAYAHHGSLSRETREVVEKRLKQGELKAIVATSSLELGIDIGALDEVLMIQTPPGIASALQRIGRAGHSAGQTSRGVLFPTHGRDVLDAAVIDRCVKAKDIEEIRPIENPLDVLAQIITSMCGLEEWNVDRLYGFLQSSAPFFRLPRKEFDLVLAMLSGRYASQRMRHLQPLVSIDRIDNTIRAKDNALRKVYSDGGTIPDRGYFTLRHRDSRSKIGELDEEFVWERRVGDTFMMGTQVWKIHQITHNDVLVFHTDEPARIAPFWRNEQINRDFYFAEKAGLFLQEADRNVKKPEFHQSLIDNFSMDDRSAHTLIDFLKRQKEQTRCGLPHRHHLVIEYTHIPGGKSDWRQGVFHTGWGGRVNHPLSMILSAAWEARSQGRAETIANNDGVLMAVTDEISLSELLLSIQPGDVEKMLRQKLESSGFFGARFRENASRALLLPRGSFGRRTPRWLHQLRSKELLEAIGQFEDFPILLETWRTCLRDEFDLEALHQLLGELQTGEIKITEVHTPIPSPFAESLVWIQTNQFVYMGDAPYTDKPSSLSNDLIKEIAGNTALRPELSPDLIARFEERLQRRFPGYAPSSERDLLDWIKDRLLIPHEEWVELCEIMRGDSEMNLDDILHYLSNKIVRITLPNTAQPSVTALENLPPLLMALDIQYEDVKVFAIDCESSVKIDWDELQRVLENDTSFQEDISCADWLGQFLTFYGPVSRPFVSQTIGVNDAVLNEALETLAEEERIVIGKLRKDGDEEEFCFRENLERLYRIMRRESVPPFTPLPVETLPLLTAHQQRLTRRGDSLEDLQHALEPLLGYACDASFWEKELLPARMDHYIPAWMDELTRENQLLWYGCGKQSVTLCFQDQIDLLYHPASSQGGGQEETKAQDAGEIIPDRQGKFDFSQLAESTNLPSGQLTERLWDAVWRGTVSNDSFGALRKGIESKFKAWEIAGEKPGGRRSGFNRWQSSRPFTGNWFALEPPVPPEDSLEELERQKECVRLLLDRYGIVFREILLRELPAMRWGSLFKAMRIMELSGELVGGFFFEGVSGLQFTRPATLHVLQEGIPADGIYWMNAADPASLCGLNLEGIKDTLPPRRQTTHLVYHGKDLVLVSMRQGKELDIRVDADHHGLPAYFGLFNDWLNRSFQPAASVSIETINGKAATESPYLSAFRERFTVTDDYKKVVLRKRY